MAAIRLGLARAAVAWGLWCAAGCFVPDFTIGYLAVYVWVAPAGNAGLSDLRWQISILAVRLEGAPVGRL